jgi:hypothetical protein
MNANYTLSPVISEGRLGFILFALRIHRTFLLFLFGALRPFTLSRVNFTIAFRGAIGGMYLPSL